MTLLAAFEEIIDASGVAARIEAMLAKDRGGPFRGQHGRTGVSCPLLEEAERRLPDVRDGIPKTQDS